MPAEEAQVASGRQGDTKRADLIKSCKGDTETEKDQKHTYSRLPEIDTAGKEISEGKIMCDGS